MMQWALRAHPQVWGSAESDFLVPLISGVKEAHDFGIVRGRMHWLVRESVERAELLAAVGSGIDSLFRSRSGGLRWVEQTPLYTLHLDDLAEMFPDARFVAMVRDGRSVVHSLMHFVEPVPHRAACRTFAKYTQAVLDFASGQQSDRMMLVRYEDAVSRPTEVLADIASFVDLPHDPACGDYISTQKPINSSFSEPEGDQPRWRSWTPPMFKYFGAVAGRNQEQLGYDDTAPDRPSALFLKR